MMDKSSSSSSTTTTTASNSSATSSDGEEMAASGTVKKNSSSQELKTSSSPSSHSQKQQQSSGMDSSKVANDQQQQQSAKHQKNSNDSNLADLIKRLKSQITQLQDLVTQKDKKIIDLNEKLDQQSDYDEIKRELSMVRSELSHFGSMVPLDPITSITTVDDDDDNNNNNNTDNNIVNNNIDDNNNDDHNDADDDDDVERSISPSAILSTEFNTISNHDDNQHQSINFPYHPPHPSMISASPATTAAVNTATTTASSSPSIFNSFNFPPLHNLGNVDAFGSLIGEEIANTYAKAMAAAAAAAASSSSSNNSLSNNNNKLNHSSSHHQHQPISNQKNSNNNDTQPSQLLNGDMMANVGNNNPNNETSLEIENNNKQLMESASTTPTASAMICSMVDGAEPLTHSPLGATTVNDLGLNTNNYSHIFYDKLQHHLRCNVEKYMNETLNTLQISRYVRELLSVHNIGQRLFAKYVLGLSQGTVSELLSKPKPWDKLTEKGRDSYRKMHAWSTDDRCINLLKMMVPRKEYGSYIGKDSNSYGKQDETSGGAGSNNVGAEERISQILSEARRSMKNVSTLNRQELLAHSFLNGENLAAASMAKSLADIKEMKNLTNDTISDNGSDRDENKSETLSLCDRKSPSSTASSSLITNPTAMATISNFYKNINDPLQNERLNNNRTPVRNLLSSTTKPNDAPNNDEIASAELIRLYQAMMTQQLEEGFRNSQNYDDIRNVIAIHQELSRLNSFQQTNPELIARLFSSSLMNGPNYLNGLPLHLDGTLQPSGGQQLIDNSANIRKVDSPQQQQQRLESNRDSPNIKLDNLLLNQIKSDTLSPSHNGNNLSTNCQQLPSTNQSTTFNNPNADSPDDSAASPLQRMQSITNSLLSQSSLPTLPSQPPRPAKAVLPPITQQQFDQYNNLNTEDIVKRVKEQLSQYSISQRLFGESVLGLSQGSVSDLLARPKPWHMLTQKGREPFIRMKMFLEDDNAIHKLVASQYKIAPEKLMRTGNFVGGTGIAPTALPVINPAAVIPPPPPQPSSQPQLPGSPQALPPHLNALASAAVAAAATNISSVKNSSNPVKGPNPVELAALKYEQSLSPSSIDNSVRSNTSSPDLVSFNRDASSPTAAAAASSSPSLSARSRLSAYNNINNNLLRPILNQQTAAPSVYELAALTSDLDTQIITTRIKETLMAHNIGQKIFGEVVLGLSQGSVSELLSKPKPWHMLSIKGREPFIRMQLWLNDTHNIDKLQTLKNERREANKRRRTHLDESLPNFKPFDNQLLNQFPNFGQLNSLGKNMVASPGSNVTSGYAGITSMQTGGQPVVKKARILFTEQQKEALRVAFSMDPYPSSATAEFLAKELNLSVRTITNWFHNHRMRLKQINSSASSSNQDQDSSNPPTTGAGGYNMGRDNVLFDQDKFRQLLEHRLADLKHRNESTNNSNNNNNISHGNNLNDSNSNQFGSSSTLYSTSQQNSPPSSNNHRMKYSPSSMFQAQSIYSNNTNSCSSPASSSSFHEEEEDLGTLDLSISSHAVNSNQFCTNRSSPDKLDSTGRSSMHDDSDDNCRDTGDDDDDDVQNAGNNNTNNNDNDQQRSKQSTRHQQNNRSGSSRRKPTNVISSSSRRKAAQPQQWVAPIDPSTLLNDDDYIDDDSPFIADSKTTDNNEDFDNHKTGDKSSNSNANNILSYDDDNQDDEDGYEIDYKSKLDDEDLDLDDDDDGGEMIQKRPVNNSDDDDDIDHINHLPFKRHKSSNSQSPPSSSSDAATTIHRKIHQECVQ